MSRSAGGQLEELRHVGQGENVVRELDGRVVLDQGDQPGLVVDQQDRGVPLGEPRRTACQPPTPAGGGEGVGPEAGVRCGSGARLRLVGWPG